MRAIPISIGDQFGRWTIIGGPDRPAGAKWRRWLCRCDCGTVRYQQATPLVRRTTTSCGCFQSERTVAANWRHGGHGTRLNRIWIGMVRRTVNPNSEATRRTYADRGIRVCDEWRDFVAFRDWALANGYRDDLSIDRIDNDGDYEPGNCRWATVAEQNRNRRTTDDAATSRHARLRPPLSA